MNKLSLDATAREQLEGAYLVGQFLDESKGTRVDGYGSDAAGRARFVHEVVHAILAGPDPASMSGSGW